jgi:hypothetical protein
MYKGGRGPESDSCSEGTRLASDGRQPARKRRKTAVISFQNGPKKAEIYWTSQSELQRMKLLRAAETPQQRQARLEQNRMRNAESRAAGTPQRRQEIDPVDEYAGQFSGKYNCTELCKSAIEPW